MTLKSCCVFNKPAFGSNPGFAVSTSLSVTSSNQPLVWRNRTGTFVSPRQLPVFKRFSSLAPSTPLPSEKWNGTKQTLASSSRLRRSRISSCLVLDVKSKILSVVQCPCISSRKKKKKTFSHRVEHGTQLFVCTRERPGGLDVYFCGGYKKQMPKKSVLFNIY